MRFYELVAYLVDGAAFASESLAGVFRGELDQSFDKTLTALEG
jgi:hypothetical protein